MLLLQVSIGAQLVVVIIAVFVVAAAAPAPRAAAIASLGVVGVVGVVLASVPFRGKPLLALPHYHRRASVPRKPCMARVN